MSNKNKHDFDYRIEVIMNCLEVILKFRETVILNKIQTMYTYINAILIIN